MNNRQREWLYYNSVERDFRQKLSAIDDKLLKDQPLTEGERQLRLVYKAELEKTKVLSKALFNQASLYEQRMWVAAADGQPFNNPLVKGLKVMLTCWALAAIVTYLTN